MTTPGIVKLIGPGSIVVVGKSRAVITVTGEAGITARQRRLPRVPIAGVIRTPVY